MIQHQQHQHHNTKARASSTSALGWKSSARSWHLNNISTKLEIIGTKLASQQHQHEVGISTNIDTKLEIFSTRLASQQHQHKAENLQHEASITTTSTRSWKSSAQGWHHHYSPFQGRSFRTTPSLSQKCSNFTRDRGLVNTSASCSSMLTYWSFMATLCTMS
jgi:hypothetical protein